MSGIYYADLLDVLRAAGCRVAENDITRGWQTRARKSGGFPAPPLGIFWHHTASSASVTSDLTYMIRNADTRPIGNLYLDRTGTYWPVAAGCSNTAGKGGPSRFSRGTIPVDGGNVHGFHIEAANNGVGERWPVEQIDAFFAGSNALSARFGNLPTDVIGHAQYTSRKIDPATAAAVEGRWRPRSTNSSGTWNLEDLRAECAARATSQPDQPIPPDEEDEVRVIYAFREYANTFSDTGVHLSAEAYTALVEAGAVVVVSELTYPQNHHLDSLLAMSGLDSSYLVPK